MICYYSRAKKAVYNQIYSNRVSNRFWLNLELEVAKFPLCWRIHLRCWRIITILKWKCQNRQQDKLTTRRIFQLTVTRRSERLLGAMKCYFNQTTPKGRLTRISPKSWVQKWVASSCAFTTHPIESSRFNHNTKTIRQRPLCRQTSYSLIRPLYKNDIKIYKRQAKFNFDKI